MSLSKQIDKFLIFCKIGICIATIFFYSSYISAVEEDQSPSPVTSTSTDATPHNQKINAITSPTSTTIPTDDSSQSPDYSAYPNDYSANPSPTDKQDQSDQKPSLKPEKIAKLQKRLKSLESKLAQNPESLRLHLRIGHIYYQLDDLDQAIFHLKKTYTKPSVKALKLLAKALSKKEDHLEEVRVRGLLLELTPHSPIAHTNMGQAYEKINKPEKAIEHYKLAIQKYNKHKMAYKKLWEIFESLKDFYEMRQVLTDFLRLFPNDMEGHSKMCQINRNTGFLDEAVEMCRKAIQLDMKNPDNHVYLGLTYKLKENNKQAKKIILTAARRFKNSDLAQYHAGMLAEENQNWEIALRFYTQCSLANQSSLQCFVKKAHLEVRLNQYPQAGESFLAACRINKSTVKEIYSVVGHLRTQGDLKGYYYFKKLLNRCRAVDITSS